MIKYMQIKWKLSINLAKKKKEAETQAGKSKTQQQTLFRRNER